SFGEENGDDNVADSQAGDEEFAGHVLWVLLDFHRILDIMGPGEASTITVTLTGASGDPLTESLEISGCGSSPDDAPDLLFPLTASNMDYTVTVTTGSALTVTGDGVAHFNSSTTTYDNGWHKETFEILSASNNRLPDGTIPVGDEAPETCGADTRTKYS